MLQMSSTRARRSLVWNHCFTSGQFIYCKYCTKRFVQTGSTSSLLHHIRNHHHNNLSDAEKQMLQRGGLTPPTAMLQMDSLIRRRSLVGNHCFTSGPYTYCRYCPRRFVLCGSTSSFLNHIKNHHYNNLSDEEKYIVQRRGLTPQRLTNDFPNIGELSLSDRQRSRSSSDPSLTSSTDNLPDVGELSLLDRQGSCSRSPMPDRSLSPAHSDASADTIILTNEERGIVSDHE